MIKKKKKNHSKLGIERNVLNLIKKKKSHKTPVAAAAKSLQLCLTLCDPIDGSPPGSPSLGFSRQEHWSGLPFPSPMHESEKWKGSRSVVSYPQRPRGLQPTRLFRPWDSPGKSTGVGCHFLLQCMKVKSESEVVQSCPTLSDPMDCSLPGSSIHGIFQARVLEWGAIAFSKPPTGSIICDGEKLETFLQRQVQGKDAPCPITPF